MLTSIISSLKFGSLSDTIINDNSSIDFLSKLSKRRLDPLNIGLNSEKLRVINSSCPRVENSW